MLQLWKNLVPWDGTEEGSSTIVTLNVKEGSSAKTLMGILGILKNCWVHQKSC